MPCCCLSPASMRLSFQGTGSTRMNFRKSCRLQRTITPRRRRSKPRAGAVCNRMRKPGTTAACTMPWKLKKNKNAGGFQHCYRQSAALNRSPTPGQFCLVNSAHPCMKTTPVPRHVLLAATLCLGATLTGSAQSPQAGAPAKPMAECTAEAKKIVAQMTLPEKISQVHGSGNRQLNGIPRLNIPQYNFSNRPDGLGDGGKGHEGPATAITAPIALAAT